MKHQALFPYKDKSEKIKCHLLQFLFGTLRVKVQCDWTDGQMDRKVKLFMP